MTKRPLSRLAFAPAVVAALCLISAPVAMAGEGSGPAEAMPAASVAHADGAHAQDGHESKGHGGSGEHWSLAALVPLADLGLDLADLGSTFIEGGPVTTVTHVLFALVVVFLLFVLLGFARAAMNRNPADLLPVARFSPLGVFQFLSDALLGLMEGLLGRELALKFLPLIGSLGFFILFSNLLGMIPGFLPPTSNLNTTFALGSVVFFATHWHGVRAHGIGYFKHFFGPILKWYALPLMLLMFCIEMISHIARPVSLGIRLFGNMFGDHAALAAFLTMGAAAVLAPSPGGVGSLVLPFIPAVLGVFVCIVQTLVFCILSTVYIYMAVGETEGEEAHH